MKKKQKRLVLLVSRRLYTKRKQEQNTLSRICDELRQIRNLLKQKNIVPLFFFALLFSNCSTIKTYAPSSSFAFVAGASHGTAQVLQHRNSSFYRVFPNAPQRFFGPESWKNKYHNFDPSQGRNRVPIWCTDGIHGFNSLTQTSCFFSGYFVAKKSLLGSPRRNVLCRRIAIQLGVSFASYTAGNYLTYNIVFK